MSLNTLIVLLGLSLLAIGSQVGFDLVLLGLAMLLGAMIGMVFAYYSTLTDWHVALVATGILSLVYVVFARTFITERLAVTSKKTNTDKLEGEVAKVITKIAPFAPGQVQIGGEIWRAQAKVEIPVQTTVRVEHVEGITLWVVPEASNN